MLDKCKLRWIMSQVCKVDWSNHWRTDGLDHLDCPADVNTTRTFYRWMYQFLLWSGPKQSNLQAWINPKTAERHRMSTNMKHYKELDKCTPRWCLRWIISHTKCLFQFVAAKSGFKSDHEMFFSHSAQCSFSSCHLFTYSVTLLTFFHESNLFSQT